MEKIHWLLRQQNCQLQGKILPLGLGIFPEKNASNII
jgi:hypothetical protein